jgi:hypothetical protein
MQMRVFIANLRHPEIADSGQTLLLCSSHTCDVRNAARVTHLISVMGYEMWMGVAAKNSDRDPADSIYLFS